MREKCSESGWKHSVVGKVACSRKNRHAFPDERNLLYGSKVFLRCDFGCALVQRLGIVSLWSRSTRCAGQCEQSLDSLCY